MFQHRKKARKQRKRKSGPSNGQAKLLAKEERDESKNIESGEPSFCGCGRGRSWGHTAEDRPSHAT